MSRSRSGILLTLALLAAAPLRPVVAQMVAAQGPTIVAASGPATAEAAPVPDRPEIILTGHPDPGLVTAAWWTS